MLLLMAGVFSSFCMGIAISTLNLLVRDILIITNSLWFVLVIFSGVHVPPEKLPEIMAVVKPFIPMSHAVSGLRSLFESVPVFSKEFFWTCLGNEFLLGLGYLGVGYIALSVIEKVARSKGRLDLAA